MVNGLCHTGEDVMLANVLTPVRTFTRAFGMPVGVWKAGSSLSATCCAFSLYIRSPVKLYNVKSPPTKRMFVSNTDNSALWNEEIFRISFEMRWMLCTYHIVQWETSGDPITGLFILLIQSHDVQRIQAVDNRCTQITRAEYAARVCPFAQWPQFVLTPGVQFVVLPGVQSHLQSNANRKVFNEWNVWRKKMFLKPKMYSFHSTKFIHYFEF